ncbi:MAG TPA: hypothetical protein VNN73_06160 [Blastocatellia bacterium]|nr:hypothetical protein [Blastocatellia bacterium]
MSAGLSACDEPRTSDCSQRAVASRYKRAYQFTSFEDRDIRDRRTTCPDYRLRA